MTPIERLRRLAATLAGATEESCPSLAGIRTAGESIAKACDELEASGALTQDVATKVSSLFDKMRAMFEQHLLGKLAVSWPLIDFPERDARLRTVRALAVELERIRGIDLFSTGLADTVIEDVIQGDWAAVRRSARWFRFETEGPETVARYAPLWAKFVNIAETEVLLAEARARGGPGAESN